MKTMNNNGVKKGIAIQAKADAAKVEKLAKGLNSHKAVLKNLESGQDEIREAMGVVLDDLCSGEAQMKYNLQITKTVSELDYTEKRVLCACIYTLITSYEQNLPIQIELYSNLERILQVSERNPDFVFENLNNIDSHTDRLVILKTICSFLFLGDFSFSFLGDMDRFYWLFAFASVKDIGDVCSAINSEYLALGIEGITAQYYPVIMSNKKTEEKDNRISTEVVEELESSKDEEKSESFEAITNIINEFVADETSFGKGVAFSEKDLKKELHIAFSNVAFESLVAVTKIERSYLIFTTYAVYIKEGKFLKVGYARLPYTQICRNNITTSKGKQAGTSKISIPVLLDDGTKKIVDIDDAKLKEERFRDLLVAINKSGCTIPQTDRAVEIKELSDKALKNLLSAIIYMLKNEGAYLTDVYCLTKELGHDDSWNQLSLSIVNEESLKSTVKKFFYDVPYPSKHDISFKVVELLIGLVSQNNILNGKPSTTLSLSMNNYIRIFDNNNIPIREYNLILKNAKDELNAFSYDKYFFLKKEIESKELEFKENIISGIEEAILKIESGFDFKVKEPVKNRVKDVAAGFQGKLTEGLTDIAEKAKKGATEILDNKRNK